MTQAHTHAHTHTHTHSHTHVRAHTHATSASIRYKLRRVCAPCFAGQAGRRLRSKWLLSVCGPLHSQTPAPYTQPAEALSQTSEEGQQDEVKPQTLAPYTQPAEALSQTSEEGQQDEHRTLYMYQ